MIGSFLIALGFFIATKMGYVVPSHVSLMVTVAATTAIWLIATFVARPTDAATLHSFYALVRPAGPGWKAIRQQTNLEPSPDSLTTALLGWIAGCFFVYAGLFGTGSFVYGHKTAGFLWLGVFILTGISLMVLIPRLWKREPVAG